MGRVSAAEAELAACMDYGREHLAEVVEAALASYRYDRDSLTRYFALLHYGFTQEYQKGLLRFYELAHQAGELAEVPELRFIDEYAGAAAGAPGAEAAPPSPAGARKRGGDPMIRMTEREALELLRSHDLLDVGARAHEVRERTVPGPLATFIVDRNINFTNVCTSGCRFCAFYCAPGAPEAYLLSQDVLNAKIQETLDLGGTAVMMQGGLHPDLDITYFEGLFRAIKERFDITIHSLSAPEIVHIAKVSGLTTAETLRRLKAAGLDSLPGGGAEILVDRVREQVAPGKADTMAWLQVMREAHQQGMASTATMMFGSVETLEDRVEHLRVLRELQDETGGFRAFIPWSFQSGHTALEGVTEQATGRGIPHDARRLPSVSGQLRAHPGLMGDSGPEVGASGPALRRRRPGQHHDRGERGGGYRSPCRGQQRRPHPRHPGSGVRARPAAHRLQSGLGGGASMISRRPAIAVALMLACVLTVAGCSSGGAVSSSTTTTDQSQEDYLYPIPVDGKWGFIDKTGEVVIEPRLYNLQPMFRGDLAAVQLEQDGPWGFIDRTGKVVIQPQFYTMGNWSPPAFVEGLAAAQLENDGLWGFIDENGEVVVQPRFESGLSFGGMRPSFSEGLAAVSAEGGCGYIDPIGSWAIEPQFGAALEFHDGLALAQAKDDQSLDGQWGLIDKEGHWVVEPQFTTPVSSFSYGLWRVSRPGDKKWVAIDQTGHVVSKPESVVAGHLPEGLCPAQAEEGGLWGYVDDTGKMAIEARFAQVSTFSEGLAAVRPEKDGPWGFIDRTGQMVIEPGFYAPVSDQRDPNTMWALQFFEGLAQVELEPDGPFGYIDETGKIVIKPQFAGGSRFFGGVAGVAEGDSGSWSYIDRTGKVIWRGKLILPQTTSTTQQDLGRAQGAPVKRTRP